MSTEFDKLREVFQVAVEQHAASQWDAYLDQACAGDMELRHKVALLLKAHAEGGSLVDQPAPDLERTGLHQPFAEGPGTVIGPYKLLEQIGEGGMGVIYMAEQTRPVRRKVALKIIKPGMDTKQVIARFEVERQALALMDHPHIAKVLDGGETASGRPYFVMELVRGIPLTAYCDRERLAIRQRLELFALVCRAVQHAHQKGVIHRDLKPSNVLVTVIDGAAVPKVIDFGVAKATGGALTERTLFTGFQQFLGTPLYMSPEQAELSGVDVDTRSDVYALGVLLYELLTGTTPFEEATFRQVAFDEMRRIIREQEPPTPSLRLSTLADERRSSASVSRGTDARHLRQQLRGELDWIVMKALEKDRNRRYESASAFAADVRRYLDDEPVQACPPSAGYRFGKFARRNKVALMTTGLVAAAMLIGTAVSVWQAVEANAARKLAGERLESEKQARHDAEAHFQKALSAVKRMLMEVGDERVAAIPQMKQTRQRLLDEALAFYTDLIASNPHHSQAYFLRGDLYDRMGKKKQARDDLEKAIECDPDNAEAHGYLGSVLMPMLEEGHEESALYHVRRALELQPTAPGSYTGFAYYYRRTKRPEEAAAAWRKAAELAPPGSAEAYYYLAEACLDVGDYRAARENSEKSLLIAPSYPEAHFGLGRAHRALGEHDQAVAAFTKVLECPQMPSWVLSGSLIGRGDLHSHQKNYAAALSDYNRVIELESDFDRTGKVGAYLAGHYKRRGKAHFYLKHYEQALADIAKAVEIGPDDVSSLTWIPPEDVALCPDEKFRTGMRALAENTIQIFQSKPSVSKTAGWHNNLAWLLATYPGLRLGDPGQAVAHAKKAVELAPGDGNYWNTLGVAQYRNGAWKAAVEALMKSDQLDKQGGSFNFFFLAMAHWQLGEKDKARAWYDQAVAWMDKNRPQDRELKRFRAEATDLLGLAKAAQTPNKKD